MATDVKTQTIPAPKIKIVEFIWGPPPLYGRPRSMEERKVRYQIVERNITMEDVAKFLKKDIMPKRFGFNLFKRRSIKIFQDDGFRITSFALIENGGVYYVDTRFPQKFNFTPKPTPTRRLGCVSTPTK